MFGVGTTELLIILFVILLLFGRKLPELGAGLGKGIKNFKKGMQEPDAIDVTPKRDEVSSAEGNPSKGAEKPSDPSA